MKFSEKVNLTKLVLPINYNKEIEIIPTNSENSKNYRNKSVQDIEQPISLDSLEVLSLKHIEIIKYLQWLNPKTPIISIVIKNNYKNEYQLTFLVPEDKINFLENLIQELKEKLKINVVSGYYQIKYPNKPKPLKLDKYYHFYGENKLLEKMDGNIIELSPNSFCRINYEISKHLYNRVFQIITNIKKDKNLICFGRDINFPIEYYNLHFKEIFGITHCPLVYGDCKPKKNLILKLSKKEEYPKKIKAYLEREQNQKYIILVTAGRNGLDKKLWEYLTIHPQVSDIIYIACGRKSLGKNIEENKTMIVKHVIVMDEFPNTESSNSIVYFSKFSKN